MVSVTALNRTAYAVNFVMLVMACLANWTSSTFLAALGLYAQYHSDRNASLIYSIFALWTGILDIVVAGAFSHRLEQSIVGDLVLVWLVITAVLKGVGLVAMFLLRRESHYDPRYDNKPYISTDTGIPGSDRPLPRGGYQTSL